METKECSKCKKTLPVGKFNKNKSKKDGLNTYCKDCNIEYKKLHYIKNKQDYLERNKRVRDWNKQFLSRYKKKLKCTKCPEDHVACLDFHHYNDDKNKEVTTLVNEGYSLAIIKDEIRKCVVLCSNCHRKLHYNEKNAVVDELVKLRL